MDQVSAAPRHSRGFSLIEVLVVLAVVGILAAIATPSIMSTVAGSDLSRAGQSVEALMAQARQAAVSNNHDVELRFYQISADPTFGWQAAQLWREDENSSDTGLVSTALTKLVTVPRDIAIVSNSTLSPLLTTLQSASSGEIQGTSTLPVYGSVPYVGFRFRATGAIDSAIDTSHNFVTLVNIHQYVSGTTPKNYYTVQVNPITGKVTSFRP